MSIAQEERLKKHHLTSILSTLMGVKLTLSSKKAPSDKMKLKMKARLQEHLDFILDFLSESQDLNKQDLGPLRDVHGFFVSFVETCLGEESCSNQEKLDSLSVMCVDLTGKYKELLKDLV